MGKGGDRSVKFVEVLLFTYINMYFRSDVNIHPLL